MKKRTYQDIPKGLPFVGTIEEFDVLLKTIAGLKEKLESSNNPREIIFESWFIFDYYIRRMLLKGFDIEDFENKKLDLMYELLPQSFDSCVKIFETLLKNQREIYSKKQHPNTYFLNQENTISFNGSFIAYMLNEKSDLFNDFYTEYWNYLKKVEPEFLEAYNSWDYEKFRVYKIAKKSWIEKCEAIDENWFKIIRKLNKCRNKAAHLYDEKYIYSELGIGGSNQLVQLKSIIVDLIKTTLKFDI